MNFNGEIDVSSDTKNWIYHVPHFVISDGKISFDFVGIEEGCRFTGHCVANEYEPQKYSGVGKFQYERNEAYESPIVLSVVISDALLEIFGTWFENGKKYKMEGELKQSRLD